MGGVRARSMMTHSTRILLLAGIAAFLIPVSAEEEGRARGPVKVFLLSGQSNMTGRGNLGQMDKPAAEQPATLLRFAKDPAHAEKYRFLYEGPEKTESGWTIRDDVFITMGEWPHLEPGEEGYNAYNKHGGLSAHFGGRGNRGFGPELAIGHLLGDHFKEPVLLVKVAFGGNSLGGNFRPPSSGGKLGDKYPLVVKGLRDALTHLPEIVEGYDEAQGYELAGFLWNQGLSDATPELADEYEANLVNLINDLRKEFETPDLKVVIGLTGNWGRKPEETLEKWGKDEVQRLEFIANLKKVQQAQIDVAKRDEFKGAVITAETRDFWRTREEHGGHGTETHWMANGESYWLIGNSMGRGMIELLEAGR